MESKSKSILFTVIGMAGYAMKDCFASNARIAEETNSSIRAVQKAIEELKNCPFVKIWYTHNGKRRHIEIIKYSLATESESVDNSEGHVAYSVTSRRMQRGGHVACNVDMNTIYENSEIKKENKQRKSPSAPVLEPRLNLVEKPSKNPPDSKSSRIPPDSQTSHPPESILKGVDEAKAVFPMQLDLPPHLDTPEGRVSAEQWRRYRKSKRKPVSAEGWATTVTTFVTVEQMIDAVKTAISNDWQGLVFKSNANLTNLTKANNSNSGQGAYRRMTTAEQDIEECRRQMIAEGIIKQKERAVN
jgi:hypothetical protein